MQREEREERRFNEWRRRRNKVRPLSLSISNINMDLPGMRPYSLISRWMDEYPSCPAWRGSWRERVRGARRGSSGWQVDRSQVSYPTRSHFFPTTPFQFNHPLDSIPTGAGISPKNVDGEDETCPNVPLPPCAWILSMNTRRSESIWMRWTRGG